MGSSTHVPIRSGTPKENWTEDTVVDDSLPKVLEKMTEKICTDLQILSQEIARRHLHQ